MRRLSSTLADGATRLSGRRYAWPTPLLRSRDCQRRGWHSVIRPRAARGPGSTGKAGHVSRAVDGSGAVIGLRGAGDLDSFLNKILRYILDLKDGDPLPEIDRTHQALRPKPNPGEPPRTIIARLLQWGDRQIILQASRKKQTLLWEGQRFFLRQDLAMEAQKQRAANKDIIDKMKTTGLRFGLLHPAKFVLTIEGKTFKYESPEATLLDLKDKLPEVFLI
ncbi:hypothetical protein SKAU_G00413100 [Synaphobranchus kaupii]|uniref:Uncharacterized protein n=1 Tax=Synaphobranchus kaupii TaxID=118154 RepID=A0A9Q1IBY7_SYNKA|nr:hypothetical protein SKAU_G00413100 [Synaphobranchus kaupii]